MKTGPNRSKQSSSKTERQRNNGIVEGVEQTGNDNNPGHSFGNQCCIRKQGDKVERWMD